MRGESGEVWTLLCMLTPMIEGAEGGGGVRKGGRGREQEWRRR